MFSILAKLFPKRRKRVKSLILWLDKPSLHIPRKLSPLLFRSLHCWKRNKPESKGCTTQLRNAVDTYASPYRLDAYASLSQWARFMPSTWYTPTAKCSITLCRRHTYLLHFPRYNFSRKRVPEKYLTRCSKRKRETKLLLYRETCTYFI